MRATHPNVALALLGSVARAVSVAAGLGPVAAWLVASVWWDGSRSPAGGMGAMSNA
jgi:hypothetical protein